MKAVANAAVLIGLALLVSGVYSQWGWKVCAMIGGPILVLLGVSMAKGLNDDRNGLD